MQRMGDIQDTYVRTETIHKILYIQSTTTSFLIVLQCCVVCSNACTTFVYDYIDSLLD